MIDVIEINDVDRDQCWIDITQDSIMDFIDFIQRGYRSGEISYEVYDRAVGFAKGVERMQRGVV